MSDNQLSRIDIRCVYFCGWVVIIKVRDPSCQICKDLRIVLVFGALHHLQLSGSRSLYKFKVQQVIKICCSIDSGDADVISAPLPEFVVPCSLFLQYGGRKITGIAMGIEPTTLDSSRSTIQQLVTLR